VKRGSSEIDPGDNVQRLLRRRGRGEAAAIIGTTYGVHRGQCFQGPICQAGEK